MGRAPIDIEDCNTLKHIISVVIRNGEVEQVDLGGYISSFPIKYFSSFRAPEGSEVGLICQKLAPRLFIDGKSLHMKMARQRNSFNIKHVLLARPDFLARIDLFDQQDNIILLRRPPVTVTNRLELCSARTLS